jgi:hypothetical protein
MSDVPVAAPSGATAGARTDVPLLDATAVHVHLGENATIAIGAVRPQRDLSRGDERTQPLLCRSATGLVELGGVDIRQADLLAVADQRIAVDGEAAQARVANCRKREKNCKEDRVQLFAFERYVIGRGDVRSRHFRLLIKRRYWPM